MNQILSFVFIIFMTSCATGGLKERNELIKLVESQQFDQSLKYLDTEKFYQDQLQQLLKLLEKGSILHLKNDYLASSLILQEAHDVASKLYTESLKGKIEKGLANDNYDIFYGATYEKSLIYYFQVLNFLHLSESSDPKVAQEYLFKARSEVFAWNNYLDSSDQEKRGESVYKNDIWAKILGGIIHQRLDTSEDRQIAIQLFLDAKKYLFRNFNIYKSYNSKSIDFKKNFSKFHEMDESKVANDFVQETHYSKGLNSFLDQQILLMVRNDRNRYKELVKQLKPSKEVMDGLDKFKKGNLLVILNDQFIPPKRPSKQHYGFSNLRSSAFGGFTADVLAIFAAQYLGLTPSPKDWNPVGFELGVNVTRFALHEVGVSFELPKVTNPNNNSTYSIEFVNNDSKESITLPLNLALPIGDIAEEAVAEDSIYLYSRIGARLAAKHLTAIASAFATYKIVGGGSNGDSFLAKNAVMLQYVALSKAIEFSEKADTRYWSVLPRNVFVSNIYLKKGKYHKFIIKKNTENNSVEKIDDGEIEIEDNKNYQLFKWQK